MTNHKNYANQWDLMSIQTMPVDINISTIIIIMKHQMRVCGMYIEANDATRRCAKKLRPAWVFQGEQGEVAALQLL